MALESSQRELQDCFRPHPNLRSEQEVMDAKVSGVQTGTISGLFLGSFGKKVPFGCSLRGELQRILYGGRWWLPPSPGRGESSESKVACGYTTTKRVQNEF